MITRDIRTYSYSTLDEKDDYGQQTISQGTKGEIDMAINLLSQSVGDNIRYSEAQYIGLTQSEVNDTFVIHYGEERLKVLYVNPKGRYKQVYMKTV